MISFGPAYKNTKWNNYKYNITPLTKFAHAHYTVTAAQTHFSGKAVRLALQWPSMSTRVLVRKLAFLCKLLSDQSDVEVISRDIFSSLASVDVYTCSISIIQQCRMLESFLALVPLLDASMNQVKQDLYCPTTNPT